MIWTSNKFRIRSEQLKCNFISSHMISVSWSIDVFWSLTIELVLKESNSSFLSKNDLNYGCHEIKFWSEFTIRMNMKSWLFYNLFILIDEIKWKLVKLWYALNLIKRVIWFLRFYMDVVHWSWSASEWYEYSPVRNKNLESRQNNSTDFRYFQLKSWNVIT